ncbi:MAG: polysaccharide deacetylase family protein [Clostridiaceae bacterium]|nr:polysaccharide deacetylase family protein [Clostridiaceae bacterium]
MRRKIFAVLSAVFILIEVSAPVDAWYGSKQPFIKWVEFHPSAAVIRQAVEYDLKTYGTAAYADYVTLLALTAAKTGGEFPSGRSDALRQVIARLDKGECVEDIAADYPYFGYYLEAYTAAIGFLYREGCDADGKWARLPAAFSPIAAGYGYSHCRDFGNKRNFGFSRRHLGNDIMGSVGTPIVAIEGGTIEALGWNRYGGWRIGIRSDDGLRYWYYAHMRRGHPYAKGIEEGAHVEAGDVIGYLGMTGYSDRENVNNVGTPHLHLGLQLVFDESQKESDNEIWIDIYEIVEYLSSRRSPVVRDGDDYRAAVGSQDDLSVLPVSGVTVCDGDAPVPLPIIMYHSVLCKPKVKSDYIVSPDTIRADIQWLLTHGYTPVKLNDIIAYVDGEGMLPERPVVLTFDDGYLNNAVYLPGIAAEFDVPFVISAVGRFSDEAETNPDRCPTYAMLRWSDYRTLLKSGYFEIANHSYDMHRLSPRKGTLRKPGESVEVYRETLSADLALMQTRLRDELGVEARVFTYPFGVISAESAEVVRASGFRTMLTCADVPNFITHSPECLYALGRMNRYPGLSTEAFMRVLLRRYTR